MAFRDQSLRTVNIGKNRIGQFRALRDARFDGGPLLRIDDQRQNIELPGTRLAVLFVIDVIGDGIVAHHVVRRSQAVRVIRSAQTAEFVEERFPMAAHLAIGRAQFVVTARGDRIVHKQAAGG